MIVLLVLEDLRQTFETVENRVRPMGKKDGVKVHIRQLKSWRDFENELNDYEGKDDPVMLCCDMVEALEEETRGLRDHLKTLWQATDDTWRGERPLIIYSRDDDLFDQISKVERKRRRGNSAVISQVASPGVDPIAALKDALRNAWSACRAQPGAQSSA